MMGEASSDKTSRAAVVAAARDWIGTPYKHQGSKKGVGCDCLGLVRAMFREFTGGEPERVPAYTPDWAEASGQETMLEAAQRNMTPVPFALAREGDILLFRWRMHNPAKHVAIISEVSPMRIIHAYDSAKWVSEGHLAREWRKMVVGAFKFPFVGD